MSEGVYLSKEWLNRLAKRLREAPDLNEPRHIAEELELATGKRKLKL